LNEETGVLIVETNEDSVTSFQEVDGLWAEHSDPLWDDWASIRHII
jgi:hypothetical protein